MQAQEEGSAEEAQARRWALKVCVTLSLEALARNDAVRASRLLSLLKALSFPRADAAAAAGRPPGGGAKRRGEEAGGAVARVMRDGLAAAGALEEAVARDAALQDSLHPLMMICILVENKYGRQP